MTAGNGNDGTNAGSADDPQDARALLQLVQRWAQRNLPAPESGHAGPECQWCPLCQLASMLRGENPEVADKLIEAGASLAAAARALLDNDTWRPSGGQAPTSRPKPGRVQPIVLDDIDDEPGDTEPGNDRNGDAP